MAVAHVPVETSRPPPEELLGSQAFPFDAVAAHLAAVDRVAGRRGTSIELVIFAPELVRRLKADPQRRKLVENVPFMQGDAWVRHDEHYHVDFTSPRPARGP